MGMLIAMTLPGLVLLLTVLGIYDLMSARSKHSKKRGTAMSSTGFDLLQEALYPSKRYEIEQRDHEALLAEEDADGAPPRSRIDLDKGTAHLHLP